MHPGKSKGELTVEMSLLRVVFGMTVPILILVLAINYRLDRVQKKLDQLERRLRGGAANDTAERNDPAEKR